MNIIKTYPMTAHPTYPMRARTDTPVHYMERQQPVDRKSPVETKILLFRSLFRGREDIYARRFESRKTGKCGYAPACANEWVRGVCEKPRVKCAECLQRRFLPITDDVIRWHLMGVDPDGAPFVAGIYPLLTEESCWFLAIDFDKSGWHQDAMACLETCRSLNLDAALERSRSGHGAHLWFFFDEPVPAALARRLGSHVLTETMERRPQLGLDSYDRIFPNQDIMPKGGFGNLIALPLQKAAREQGNSVFLDDDLEPWADQWAFLASLHRLSRGQVESTVREAERRGQVLGVRLPPQEDDENEPWAAPPSRRHKAPAIAGDLPKSVELVLGNQIYVAKKGLPAGMLNRLLRLAAFQNPAFYQAQAMRLSTTPPHESSLVPRPSPTISACREGAWRRLLRHSMSSESVRRFVTSGAVAKRSRWPSEGSSGQSNKQPRTLWRRTIPACWRLRRRSARR